MDCTLTYATNYTAIAIGTNLLVNKYNFEMKHSSIIITLPYLTSVILMPILGWYVDKTGKRLNWVLICGILNIVSHVWGFLHPECDMCVTSVVPFVLYGLQLTIYNVVSWGMIPYLVPENSTGTAYGIVTSCQNIGTTLMPLVMSSIHDHTKGNKYVDIVFILFCLWSMFFKFCLYRWDVQKRNGILQGKNPAE